MKTSAAVSVLGITLAGCDAQPAVPPSPELAKLYSKPNVFESIPKADWTDGFADAADASPPPR